MKTLQHTSRGPGLYSGRYSPNVVEIQFPEVRIFHMTADRPELVRHTGAVNDQRGCAEG
jgi:2-succinyl-5-enolpyruvyl-6-hydroxy-3-cyclohexene-1-carboxylate synthase